jgi:predicted transposase YdaD
VPAPKWTDLTETRFYKEVAQTGAADMTLQQLSLQCGALSIAQQDQVRSLSSDQLSHLGAALLRFTGMEDLERWLGENVEG